MMDLSVDLGLHGTPSLYHENNGYYFRCYRVRGLTAYLRCTEFRLGCPVRGLIRAGERFQLNNNDHNHVPNFELIPYLQERRMLIEEAKRLDIASFQEIFNHRRIEFDNDLTNSHMYRSMLRERMNMLPQLNSLRELLNALEDQSYNCISATRYFGEILFKDSSRLADGSTVILFLSPRCASFLQISPDIFIVQSLIGNYSLLTIGCLWEKRVICSGFILMDGRKAANFNAAFCLLRTHLNTWVFQEVICGEADPLPSAFAYIFGVPLFPSLYDFMRDAKSFIIPEEVMQTTGATYLLGLCFSLTLLPLDFIPTGILFIETEFRQLQADNVQLIACMREVLKMPHFAICAEKDRTNVGIERLRDQLNRHFLNFNGNIYAITRFIVSSIEKSLSKIDSISRAERPPSTSAHSSLLDDNESKKLFKDLIQPPLNLHLSVVNFMKAMVAKLSPFL